MQYASLHSPSQSQYVSTVRQPLGEDVPHARLTQERCAQNPFMEMLDSYRQSGGLARSQAVFALFKSLDGAGPAILARWIVKRSVISFDWQSRVWIPLFQFSPTDMTPVPGLVEVLTVLNPVFEPLELAHWFSQPNRWLANHGKPADVIHFDVQGVLRAACADRFIAD